LVKTFANGAGQVAFDPFTRLCKEFISNQIHPQSKPFPLNGPQVKDELVLLLHGGTLERWPYADIAQVLQQILNSKGLATRIVIQEAGSFHETVKARQYDIAIQPYTLMTGDPDFFYSYFIAADAPRNVGYTNKSADSLIIDARRRMDQKKRKKNYLQLAQIVSQDLPVLPLYHDISLYAHRSSMSDFEMDQLFRPVLTQGTLWQ
jgi:peptide/nickel transport system substrate-binding protein